MYSQFVLNIFSIIPLLFTIALAQKHVVQSSKNKYYIYASLLTISLLVMEIIVTLLAAVKGPELVSWHKIINIVGFSLSPIVPYVILQFISKARNKFGLWSIWVLPLYANIIICIASFWSDLIFVIDAENQYFRGDLFFIPTFVSMVYFIHIGLAIWKNRSKVSKADEVMLFMIFILPIVSTTVQIMQPNLLLIWPSIAITLLLYYIHTLELQFDFDLHTQIKNRSAFEKHLNTLENRKNVTLFVFDLNNLKKTNDTHGHAAGDALIQMAAKILNKHFDANGEVFRIGGDEFCAICPVLSSDEVVIKLKAIMEDIQQAHFSSSIHLSLAYGYSHYDISRDATIAAALSRADDAMYAFKGAPSVSQN